ncbi:hypothetical protein DFH09DRAFT_1110628 [Mycena vulgaris]|nr:hypothetical protein DFH09DRAFT_1110628 [Mycena vulgaris]
MYNNKHNVPRVPQRRASRDRRVRTPRGGVHGHGMGVTCGQSAEPAEPCSAHGTDVAGGRAAQGCRWEDGWMGGEGSNDSSEGTSRMSDTSPVLLTSTLGVTPSPPPLAEERKDKRAHLGEDDDVRQLTMGVMPVIDPPRLLRPTPYVPATIAHLPPYSLEALRAMRGMIHTDDDAVPLELNGPECAVRKPNTKNSSKDPGWRAQEAYSRWLQLRRERSGMMEGVLSEIAAGDVHHAPVLQSQMLTCSLWNGLWRRQKSSEVGGTGDDGHITFGRMTEHNTLEENDAMKYTIIAPTAGEAALLQYLTPFYVCAWLNASVTTTRTAVAYRGTPLRALASAASTQHSPRCMPPNAATPMHTARDVPILAPLYATHPTAPTRPPLPVPPPSRSKTKTPHLLCASRGASAARLDRTYRSHPPRATVPLKPIPPSTASGHTTTNATPAARAAPSFPALSSLPQLVLDVHILPAPHAVHFAFRVDVLETHRTSPPHALATGSREPCTLCSHPASPSPAHFASRAAPPPLKPTPAHIRRAHPPAPHVRCASFLAARRLPRSRLSRKRQRQRPQHQRPERRGACVPRAGPTREARVASRAQPQRGGRGARGQDPCRGARGARAGASVFGAHRIPRKPVPVLSLSDAEAEGEVVMAGVVKGRKATAHAVYVRPPGLEGGASASGDGVRSGRGRAARGARWAGCWHARPGVGTGERKTEKTSRCTSSQAGVGEGLAAQNTATMDGTRITKDAPGLALPEERSTVRAAELYKVMHAVLPRFPALHTLLLTRPPTLYPPRPAEPPSPRSPSLFFLSPPATPGFLPPPAIPHARTPGQALLSLRVPPPPSFRGPPSEDVAAWLRWAVSPRAALTLILTLPVPLALRLSLHWSRSGRP